MKRLKIFFLFLMVLVFSVPLLAQGDEIQELLKSLFNLKDTVILAIMSIFGLGVIAITQVLKNVLLKLFKVVDEGIKNIIGYAVSLLVSGGASAFILVQAKEFTWLALLGYTAYVWLEANQIFKIFKKPSKPS